MMTVIDDPIFVTSAHHRKYFGSRGVVALVQRRPPGCQPVAFAKPDPKDPVFFMLGSSRPLVGRGWLVDCTWLP